MYLAFLETQVSKFAEKAIQRNWEGGGVMSSSRIRYNLILAFFSYIKDKKSDKLKYVI